MKLRHLRENISLDPKINDQIEAALAAFPKREQTHLLDALDALKMAGDTGLSPAEWAAKVRELHPDADMAELLKTTVKTFPFAVARIGDRQYGYREDSLGGMDPQVKAAAKAQVRLAGEVMKIMQQLGQFTLDDLADRISTMTGMPHDAALQYAEHYIGQFLGGKISKIGPDNYAIEKTAHKTPDQHVQDLKDLIKRAGIDPRSDQGSMDEQIAPAAAQLSPQDKAKQDQLIARLNKAANGLDMLQVSKDTIEKQLGTIHDDAGHRAMALPDLEKLTAHMEDIVRREQAAKAQQQAQPAPRMTAQQQAAAAQQASTF